MWLKKFRKRKLQSFMIFVMVMICSLLMTGSMVILSSLDKPYAQLATETNAPGMKVYPTINVLDSNKDWITELEDLDCVKKVYQIDRHFMDDGIEVEGKKKEVFVSAVEYEQHVFGKVRLLEGSMKELKDGECFIPSTLANSNDIKLGDTVSLFYGNKEFKYTVKAFFADVYSLNTSFQMEILINKLPAELRSDPYFAVYLEDGAVGNDVVEEYTNSHDGLLDGNFNSKEEGISNAHITENILGAILLVLSIIIFLVTLVMLRYMIRNALLKDQKTIAIYKSMGYTEKMVVQIYLTFYQVVTLLGTLMGVFASPLITRAFMKAAFANLGETNSTVGLFQGFLCMAIINCFVCIQILFELRKLRELKPVTVLSGNENHLGIKKKKEPKDSVIGFSPCSMALRMITRDKKNTALIILTCLLSAYMVNLGIVCFDNIAGMKNENYYWLGFDHHDVTLISNGNSETFQSICEELEDNKEVSHIVKCNLDSGFCIPYHQSVAAMVYETYDDVDIPIIEGRSPKNGKEVVIGNIYAKELKKNIGDYLDIYLSPDKKVSLLIVGTYQGFYNMGRGIRISGEALEENGIAPEYVQASLYLKDSVDKTAFIKKMKEKYGKNITVKDRINLYDNIIDEITDPQKAAIGPFIILAVLIGSLNVIYIIYLKNQKSKKTFSIYKSLGYPASHLLKMNCYYVGIIAVISMAVALPLFRFTFPKTMILAMSTFGFAEYKVTFRAMPLLLGNMIVLVVFLIGILLSGRELYKNHLEDLIIE